MKMPKKTGLVFFRSSHECLWDKNYPECPGRVDGIINRFTELELIKRCVRVPFRTASRAELSLVHTENHITKLEDLDWGRTDEELEELSSKYDSIYFHPFTYRDALLAAGSAIDLVKAVSKGKVQNGMAIIRPPGHHAMRNEYNGYCFFNNVAIAAECAFKHLKTKRILIIDWDVHHGQGIQRHFMGNENVLYFSIHRYEKGSFWPNLRESNFDCDGKGDARGFNVNVPLEVTGLGNADYLAIFHQLLMPLAAEFNPELIIIASGFDAVLGDYKGEMQVTPACYAHFIHHLSAFASGKLAVILEGGYYQTGMEEGAAFTLQALLGDVCPKLEDTLGKPSESVCETIKNVIACQRLHWKCFDIWAHIKKPYEWDEKKWKLVEDVRRPDSFETRDFYPKPLPIDELDRKFKHCAVTTISPTESGTCVILRKSLSLNYVCKYVKKYEFQWKNLDLTSEKIIHEFTYRNAKNIIYGNCKLEFRQATSSLRLPNKNSTKENKLFFISFNPALKVDDAFNFTFILNDEKATVNIGDDFIEVDWNVGCYSLKTFFHQFVLPVFYTLQAEFVFISLQGIPEDLHKMLAPDICHMICVFSSLARTAVQFVCKKPSTKFRQYVRALMKNWSYEHEFHVATLADSEVSWRGLRLKLTHQFIQKCVEMVNNCETEITLIDIYNSNVE